MIYVQIFYENTLVLDVSLNRKGFKKNYVGTMSTKTGYTMNSKTVHTMSTTTDNTMTSTNVHTLSTSTVYTMNS